MRPDIPDDFSQLSDALLELIVRSCANPKSVQQAEKVLTERKGLGESRLSQWRVGPVDQEGGVRLMGLVAARSADEALRIFREEITYNSAQVCNSRVKLSPSDPRVKGMYVIFDVHRMELAAVYDGGGPLTERTDNTFNPFDV